MNYNDWVDTFEERTPEHLTGIVNAIDTLEKDVDIKREFDYLGIFAGFIIRSAAKEALRTKEEQRVNDLAKIVYTMTIDRIVEEYPHVDPARITCPVTLRRVVEWVRETRENKYKDAILDTAGAIIDTIIDDVHLYYPDLRSRFLKEADVDPGAGESECSILYGDSYYSLEDSMVEMLTVTFESKALPSPNDGGVLAILTTPYFWDCECGCGFIHPRSELVCLRCEATIEGQPDSRVSEVVSAKLKGEI